jgi:hypothetical protein
VGRRRSACDPQHLFGMLEPEVFAEAKGEGSDVKVLKASRTNENLDRVRRKDRSRAAERLRGDPPRPRHDGLLARSDHGRAYRGEGEEASSTALPHPSRPAMAVDWTRSLTRTLTLKSGFAEREISKVSRGCSLPPERRASPRRCREAGFRTFPLTRGPSHEEPASRRLSRSHDRLSSRGAGPSPRLWARADPEPL